MKSLIARAFLEGPYHGLTADDMEGLSPQQRVQSAASSVWDRVAARTLHVITAWLPNGEGQGNALPTGAIDRTVQSRPSQRQEQLAGCLVFEEWPYVMTSGADTVVRTVLYVELVAVDPQCQGLGIGTMMLGMLYRGEYFYNKLIALHTHQRNVAAAKFYRERWNFLKPGPLLQAALDERFPHRKDSYLSFVKLVGRDADVYVPIPPIMRATASASSPQKREGIATGQSHFWPHSVTRTNYQSVDSVFRQVRVLTGPEQLLAAPPHPAPRHQDHSSVGGIGSTTDDAASQPPPNAHAEGSGTTTRITDHAAVSQCLLAGGQPVAPISDSSRPPSLVDRSGQPSLNIPRCSGAGTTSTAGRHPSPPVLAAADVDEGEPAPTNGLRYHEPHYPPEFIGRGGMGCVITGYLFARGDTTDGPPICGLVSGPLAMPQWRITEQTTDVRGHQGHRVITSAVATHDRSTRWRSTMPATTAEIVAVKLFSKSLEVANRECRYATTAAENVSKYDQVVQVRAVALDPVNSDFPALVMERAVGSLNDFTQPTSTVSQRVALTSGDAYWKHVANIGLALVNAVRILHENGIVHLDLKPANVLVFDDSYKVADFGLSKRLLKPPPMPDEATLADGQDQLDSRAEFFLSQGGGAGGGTAGYAAPEQSDRSFPLAFTNDFYGIGAVLCYLCSGEPPTHTTDDGRSNRTLTFMSYALGVPPPDSLKQLITMCLQRDPNKRPPLKAIVTFLNNAAEELNTSADGRKHRMSVAERHLGVVEPTSNAEDAVLFSAPGSFGSLRACFALSLDAEWDKSLSRRDNTPPLCSAILREKNCLTAPEFRAALIKEGFEPTGQSPPRARRYRFSDNCFWGIAHYVAWSGRVELCVVAEEFGFNFTCDKDIFGRTPWHCAALGGVRAAMKYCFQRGGYQIPHTDVMGFNMLHYAAWGGHLAACQWLIGDEAGSRFEIQYRTPVDRRSYVHFAALGGCHETLAYFHSKGLDMAELTADGRNIAHYGCLSGNIKMVQHIESRFPDMFRVRDAEGRLPIAFAVLSGGREMIDRSEVLCGVLISDFRDHEDRNLLHYAAWGQCDATLMNYIAERLGGDGCWSARDKRGRLPLHYAALSGSVHTISTCLAHGGALDDRDTDGHDARDYAVLGGSHNSIRVCCQISAADEGDLTAAAARIPTWKPSYYAWRGLRGDFRFVPRN